VRLNYLSSATGNQQRPGANSPKIFALRDTYSTCEMKLGQGSGAEDVAKQMGSDYSIGQCVYLKADPNRQGPIIDVLPPVGGRYHYRVFHTPIEIREYYAEQLCSLIGTTQEGPEARTIFDIPHSSCGRISRAFHCYSTGSSSDGQPLRATCGSHQIHSVSVQAVTPFAACRPSASAHCR
jgi:hypothetical protein